MSLGLDIRMGRCSGIPLCCIAWFVVVWPLFQDTSVHVPPRQQWYLSLTTPGSEHVQCPACILRRRVVTVRDCTPACGHRQERGIA